MDRDYVGTNILSVSISAFVLVYLFLVSTKSSYLYTDEGSLRQFGIGKSGQTVLPAWLVSILTAILLYLAATIYSSGIPLSY